MAAADTSCQAAQVEAVPSKYWDRSAVTLTFTCEAQTSSCTAAVEGHPLISFGSNQDH